LNPKKGLGVHPAPGRALASEQSVSLSAQDVGYGL